MEFVDIAGLVAGASKGEGLGNQFLAHIRETDAIAHVVRCFVDEDIIHVANKIDPIADMDVIDTELALADLDSVEKAIKRYERLAKGGDKEANARIEVLKLLLVHLDQGKPARSADLDKEQRALLSEVFLLTSKPVMYVCNVLEDGYTNNPLLDLVKARAVAEGAQVVAICARIEEEISQLDAADQIDFLKEMGLEEPGLNRVIRAGYKLLGMQTYFTAGEKEVRAWQIRAGSTAPQAAGVIHTRDQGKMRLEGKEYIVKEGDVMHFRFNV